MAYLNPTAGSLRQGAQAIAVANAGAATAAAAVGAAPTKAEYDALLADVNALRTKYNALLTALRTAGQLAA